MDNELPGMWELADFTGGETDMTEEILPKCVCSILSGPEPDCPVHGECASYGHVGHCDGCPTTSVSGS